MLAARFGGSVVTIMWTRQRVGLIVASVGVVVAIGTVAACAAPHPSLRANITNGASRVPLDTSVRITADSALIKYASIERVDVPSDPIPLVADGAAAEMALKLEPDAQYRIAAKAEPMRGTALPWDNTPSPQISLDQVFSTVETPLLEPADGPRTISRDKPLELRYSQPIAQAKVSGDGVSAAVSKSDPRVLEITMRDPEPGAQLALDVTDVVGSDGVASPDANVAVQVPSPVQLAGVSGKALATRVGLDSGAPVTLDWSRPVASVKYQVGDNAPQTWTGAAVASVPLPLTAPEGDPQTLKVLDAVAGDGGWLTGAQTFEIATTKPLQLVAMWPTQGEENITPSSAPVFRFSEDIADRAAAEDAITFDPPTPGKFDWLAPNRVRFLPDNAFPSNSDVTISVDGNPRRIRGVSGGYLEDATKATYSTGKLKVIDVSLSKQVMTLFEDDQPVWSSPVATGVGGAPTPEGHYSVQYKMPVARFRGTNPNGTKYDIPDVHWVMAFMGDYTIHGAYWRSTFGQVGSAGCVSLSDANAKHVFDWAEDGTPIVIHR